MKQLRCKKEYGTYYYEKESCKGYGTCDLRFDIYYLYDSQRDFIAEFGSINDMKYYIETGIIL